MLRIIADSTCDISKEDARKMGIQIVPISVRFGDEEFLDGVEITHEEFYTRLAECDELPKTSQPSPDAFMKVFNEAVADGDDVLGIFISSDLSGTYQSACIAASEYEDKVYVVDSENVTVGEQILVDYAVSLINKNICVEDIVKQLNTMKKRIRLVALLDTLEYLKKGGRISSGAAFLGNVLSIKPVIAIADGEVSFLGKARGSKQGNNFLIQQVQAYGGIDYSLPVLLGYTGYSTVLMDKYIKDSKELWEGKILIPPVVQVGATIGTHIGPGGIAVAFFSEE